MVVYTLDPPRTSRKYIPALYADKFTGIRLPVGVQTILFISTPEVLITRTDNIRPDKSPGHTMYTKSLQGLGYTENLSDFSFTVSARLAREFVRIARAAVAVFMSTADDQGGKVIVPE